MKVLKISLFLYFVFIFLSRCAVKKENALSTPLLYIINTNIANLERNILQNNKTERFFVIAFLNSALYIKKQLFIF